MGNILLRKNQPADALPYLEKALLKDAQDVELLLDIGESLLRLNRLGEAEDRYRDVLLLSSKSAHAHYNLALLYGNQGKPNEALAHYQSAVRLMRSPPPVLYNYGNLLSRSGQLEEAKKAYGELLKGTPVISNTYNNVGLIMLQEERYDEAVSYFRKALCIESGNRLAEENLNWAQQQLDVSKKAELSPIPQ